MEFADNVPAAPLDNKSACLIALQYSVDESRGRPIAIGMMLHVWLGCFITKRSGIDPPSHHGRRAFGMLP